LRRSCIRRKVPRVASTQQQTKTVTKLRRLSLPTTHRQNPISKTFSYSWGPPKKVENIRKIIGDGQTWNGPPNGNAGVGNGRVWATISPVSTYSYGLVPIRFKFKPKTRFSENQEKSGTVQDNYHGLEDFIIYDSSVIESWSYGTPEHYDEIIKDILRISSGKRAIAYLGFSK
jgi:hypothetical protein